jgi:hypothetical protein
VKSSVPLMQRWNEVIGLPCSACHAEPGNPCGTKPVPWMHGSRAVSVSTGESTGASALISDGRADNNRSHDLRSQASRPRGNRNPTAGRFGGPGSFPSRSKRGSW